MKKLLILLVLCLLLTGCGNTNFKAARRTLKNMDYFSNNEELSKDDVEYRFDIDTSHFSDMFVYYFNSKESANFVMVVKVTDTTGKEEYDKLKKMYEGEWLDIVYDEDEAKKVDNHLEVLTDNGYYIYIVSDDNSKVYEAVKDSL